MVVSNSHDTYWLFFVYHVGLLLKVWNLEDKLNKEEEEERLSIIPLPQENFCLYLYGGLLPWTGCSVFSNSEEHVHFLDTSSYGRLISLIRASRYWWNASDILLSRGLFLYSLKLLPATPPYSELLMKYSGKYCAVSAHNWSKYVQLPHMNKKILW